MSPKAWGGALALLLAAQGCDKLRSIPGFEPATVVPAPPPPQVSMGPWLLDPLPGQVTVAWTTLEPSLATVGDHEVTDDGAAYSRFFQHRGRPAYWSVDHGPVHIVVLDSFETSAGATPHRSAMSEAQKAWFEEDLRGVPKERHVWVL